MGLEPLEPDLGWVGRKYWIGTVAVFLLALTALGLGTVWFATRQADPTELIVYGQPALSPGARVLYRAQVADARKNVPLRGGHPACTAQT